MKNTGNTTNVASGVATFVVFDGEDLDSDGFHSNTTNNTRMTIPSGKGGKYLITWCVQWDGPASSTSRESGIRKNGSSYPVAPYGAGTFNAINSSSYILDLVAGDYIEIYVYQNSGNNLGYRGTTAGNGAVTNCSGTLLGA